VSGLFKATVRVNYIFFLFILNTLVGTLLCIRGLLSRSFNYTAFGLNTALFIGVILKDLTVPSNTVHLSLTESWYTYINWSGEGAFCIYRRLYAVSERWVVHIVCTASSGSGTK